LENSNIDMALNGGQLGKLIFAQCASRGILGAEMNKFSTAMGEGIVESFVQMNKVQTIDVGVMTVGTGTGKMMGIIPNALAGMVIPLMMGQGVMGTKMKDLAEGICFAAAMHFNSMNEVQTSHSTVALGSGTGKVLGLIPSVMEAKILQKMLAQNYSGTMMKPLVNAFSTGFCNNVMATAIVTVAISGAPAPITPAGPVPSAGSGTGKVK